MEYKPELAKEFEKAYMLLADIYINLGKRDLAQELCKKCIVQNQSCAKVGVWVGLGVCGNSESLRDPFMCQGMRPGLWEGRYMDGVSEALACAKVGVRVEPRRPRSVPRQMYGGAS